MKKTRKTIIICASVIVLLAVLFVPIQSKYDDGGTVVYSALTYKIIKWNNVYSTYDEDGKMSGIDFYKKTSIYLLPSNFKSTYELWEEEKTNIKNQTANKEKTSF